MSNNLNKILFFGEVPERSLHGISLANTINIEMLKERYIVDIITESSQLQDHNKTSFRKFINYLLDDARIIRMALLNRYKYFYLVFSLTTFGCLKTLIGIIAFRMFNRGDVILHIHRGDFFSRFYKNIINKTVTKFIFMCSEKIIVLSEGQSVEFENIFSRKFYILKNAITKEVEPKKRSLGRLNFLYISNYMEDKGIYDLLDVFSSLIQEYKNIRLKTFGDFPDLRSKKRITDYKSANIIISGRIEESEKYNELTEADCFIMPSWNEGQPLVLLEAMSVKTPVIASSVGLIPEMLGRDYPFLIPPRNKEMLRQKIIEYIYYHYKNVLGDSLYERYYNNYSRNRHFIELSNIFV
jgi:glycosyltransferase involved in cell wall biosynthesis